MNLYSNNSLQLERMWPGCGPDVAQRNPGFYGFKQYYNPWIPRGFIRATLFIDFSFE